MERPWAFWRRVQYGTLFSVVLGFFGVGIYYTFLYTAPSCSDLVQNGEERGIDCGGVCTRICTADVFPPKVSWAQAFRVAKGQYNVVAYVENQNRTAGTAKLSYTMKLFDGMGSIIAERNGTTVFPPEGMYPVFEGRVLTNGKIPAKASIEFIGDTFWEEGGGGRSDFKLERRELTDVGTAPRLTADVRNESSEEAREVEIIATIFDSNRRPLTAARTFEEYFPGRTTKSVVFTWPEPIAMNLKSCEIPTDVALAIDLSGSMNNDGGNPPEPITSVLAAAYTFANELKGENDQIGLITYATGASTTEELTRDNERVADVIKGLTISPNEETGVTNTGDALKRMEEELNSSRHNKDARKVAILLTDGLPTTPDEEPEQYAEVAATALKETGILLYTIGLGSNTNESFLRSIASDVDAYYRAPSTRELSDIYTAITKSICDDGPTVIEVIAKPRSSFR